ncbi:Fc.00g002310.m01.CDS01 [Cosmosporella sp. VM-42]
MNSTFGACAECDDSALSVAGNVLGILTFGIAFLGSCLAFLAVTRSAAKEVKSLGETLDQTRKHIEQIDEYFDILDLRSDPDLERMRAIIDPSLQGFQDVVKELQKKQSKFANYNSLLKRSLWWYEEKDIAAGLAKLESHRQHFSAIQLTFLLSKLKKQGDDIEKLKKKAGVGP